METQKNPPAPDKAAEPTMKDALNEIVNLPDFISLEDFYSVSFGIGEVTLQGNPKAVMGLDTAALSMEYSDFAKKWNRKHPTMHFTQGRVRFEIVAA